MTTLAPVIDLAERRVERLVRDNRAWAMAIGRRRAAQAGGNLWSGDAESAALEGLWQAAQRWEPSGTTDNFRGWAYRRVMGAVIDEYRKLTHPRRVIRCSSCNGTNDLCETCHGTGHPMPPKTFSLNHPSIAGFEPVAPSDDSDDLTSDELRDLAGIALDEKHRQGILSLLDGNGWPRVAEELGVTESRISQIVKESAPRMLKAAKRSGLTEGGDAA
jgi:RNA polymerase sigma factor (sigma-70 family)